MKEKWRHTLLARQFKFLFTGIDMEPLFYNSPTEQIKLQKRTSQNHTSKNQTSDLKLQIQ